MQSDVSASGVIYLCYSLRGRYLANYLRITRHPPRCLHSQGRWASFLYRERLGALLIRCLAYLSHRGHVFSLLGPAGDRFHVVGAQRVPVIPLSISLAPPTFSPYLDANEEINIPGIGSLGC